MTNRPPITHLLAITLTLAALAAGAWFYTNANDPVEGIPESVEAPADGMPAGQAACEEAGGVWNECASACPPEAEACTLNCVQKCEGLGEGEQVVFVYYPNSQMDPDHLDCSVVFPVKRAITDDPDLEASAALKAMLMGPTDAEKAEGYFTSLPDGVALDSLTMRKATAHADFSKELSAVAGSCRVLSIRAQIEETLMQFPGVTSAVISVDGNFKDALQP
ncbi:MAG TPA: GerMN domain-containing protein [Candidatus Baltobacteraceae bacterium]|nr:GerMN domain-containing protein [Candidatus Baltobacteraceae bacterium]